MKQTYKYTKKEMRGPVHIEKYNIFAIMYFFKEYKKHTKYMDNSHVSKKSVCFLIHN